MSVPRSSLRPTTRRSALLVGFALITALFPAGIAAAEPPTTKAADEVLVRYRADTPRAERGRVAREHGLTPVRTSKDGRTQVVVAEGRSPATVRRELKNDPRVLAVADNHRRELTDDFTDEPFFRELWGLHNSGQTLDGIKPQTGISDIDIDGLEALRITRGDEDVVVAVVDDGIDFSHPDLASQAWTNPGEAGAKAANGVDDDGNGFIDDVHGWDFCNNDNTVSDPGEDFHGTHVAGTIAASLNGTGIVGVAPGIKVMAVKFIDDSSTCGADDMAIAAIDYAASFDVPIINASWGGPDPSSVLDAAIAESGALLVAAAGNGNRSTGVAHRSRQAGRSALLSGQLDAPQRRDGRRHRPAGSARLVLELREDIGRYRGSGNECPFVDPERTRLRPVLGVDRRHVDVRTARVRRRGARPQRPERHPDARRPPSPSAVDRSAAGFDRRQDRDRSARERLARDRHGGSGRPSDQPARDQRRHDRGLDRQHDDDWPAATDAMSGVKDYAIKRSLNGTWTTLQTGLTARTYKRTMAFKAQTRFQLLARDAASNYGAGAIGPIVTAYLAQDGTAAARYTGTWSNVSLSTASGRRLHRSTRANSTVTFTTSARAIAIVARRGPLNGKAKVYVDGVYKSTIDTYRSSYQSRVVVFNISWNTAATHSVKVVVLATSRRPRIDIDAFAFLR